MPRFVIDLACALKIVEAGIEIAPKHEILAPTLLRSQVLNHFFSRTLEGELSEADALALNAEFGKRKFRYLGDAVLRRRAWTIARQLALPTTFEAEYIALTQLQADVLVAEDKGLADLAKDLVAVRSMDVLG